jgi:RNA polymerase sigma factor (TIGR02999 family)
VPLEEIAPAEDEKPVETARLTVLLRALGRGDETVLGDLMPLVYGHLRRLARAQLARERPGHTLDSVALVSEAFLRLHGSDQPPAWESRAHFFGVAAGVMRRILIDQARARAADKRGGGDRPVTLDEAARPAVGAGLAGQEIPLAAARSFESPEGLLALDAALRELESIDGEASRVVELRFFAGATEEEAAEAMRLSPATARRRWAFAKAWLQKALDPSGGPAGGGA